MVHIMGNAVSAVKRGRMNALRPQMERKFKTYVKFATRLEELTTQDLTVDQVLSKLSFEDEDEYDLKQDGKNVKALAMSAYNEHLTRERRQAEEEHKLTPVDIIR